MTTITLSQIEQFRQHLVNTDKAPSTIQKYCAGVRKFAKWLGEKDITAQNLRDWREVLAVDHSPATVNGYLCAVNSFLDFLNQSDQKIRGLSLQRRTFIEENRELSEKEFQKLLDGAKRWEDKRLYYILLTLGHTGIRISELRFITIEALRKGRAIIRNKGKCRTIIIPKLLRRELLRYGYRIGVDQGCLFVTRGGKPVDRSNIHHDMKRLCRMAGVNKDKVFPHNFRHFFARAFYDVEKNISWLADILGHSSIETTRIYLRTTLQEQERVFEKMSFYL